MTTLDKLIKTRTALILDHCFFGMLAMKLRLVEDNRFQTAATDGEDMRYNEQFVVSLSRAERLFLFAHEVMHCVLGHFWRCGDRDEDLWNCACDYVINLILVDEGFTPPKGCLLDSSFRGMSAEEVYNKLLQKQQQQKQQGGDNGSGPGKPGQGKPGQGKPGQGKPGQNPVPGASDPGRCGGIIPVKDPQKRKEQEGEWRVAASQAAQVARGTIGVGLANIVKDIVEPKIPWFVLLRDFVEKTAKNDYNWTRPNRRYISQGIILPSLVSEEIPEIVMGTDTSASIWSNQKDVDSFASETSGVLGAYDTTVRVLYCDTEIKGEEIFTRQDLPLKFHPKGGGGTKFEPVFEYVEQHGIQPSCLIYLTDLDGTFPSKEPPYPVLWISTNRDPNKKAPFGTTIPFKSV